MSLPVGVRQALTITTFFIAGFLDAHNSGKHFITKTALTPAGAKVAKKIKNL
jgi:hypothetical protein